MSFKKLFTKLVNRGVALDSIAQKQLKRYKASARERARATGLADAVGTYGQLVQLGERFTKPQIVERGFFHEHCTYVLGSPIATPPTAKDVEAAMAENARMREQAKAEGKRRLAKGQAKIARGDVCIVFSTENLLLNAYRQQCSGFPAFMCVDFTHRLVLEKYNLCVIGTVDPAQHFHFIALAMTSHEDEATHERIFKLVRDEVDAIVEERAAKKQRV